MSMKWLKVKKSAIGRNHMFWGEIYLFESLRTELLIFKTRYTPVSNDCEVSEINLKDFESFDIQIDV